MLTLLLVFRNNNKIICISQGLRYKNLGKSGLRVSNVGLGTWSIFSNGVTEEQAETIVWKLVVEEIFMEMSKEHAHNSFFIGEISLR